MFLKEYFEKFNLEKKSQMTKKSMKNYFPPFFRDENKQEEVWKQTMEYLKDHFTEEEIYCLEGADPKDT